MTYTTPRTAQVFDDTTTEAQAGDYFRLPLQPIHRVLAAVDFGDYVGYIVQAGNEKPEQWDVMKTEVIFGEITEITSVDSQKQKEDYDWLTQPIGASPDAIFGKFIEPSDEEIATFPVAETGYHDPDWTDENTEF